MMVIGDMPNILSQWHPTKNGDLDPLKIGKWSKMVAWWQCPVCGYEWKASVKQRASISKGKCPACTNQVVTKWNCLSITHPHLVWEWHPSKNYGLLPSDVVYGSDRKVWWFCSKCGHEWLAKINSRTGNGYGCNRCGSVSVSYNQSLDYCLPSIADFWDHRKNGPWHPSEVGPHSAKKVWWICPCGHTWLERICHVAKRINPCRRCFPKRGRISFASQKWLDELKVPWENREARICFPNGKKIWVDAVDGMLVYEFLGTFWHGHPDKHSPNDTNIISKITFGELYQRTLERLTNISQLGYELIIRWEHEDKDKRFPANATFF